MDWIGPTLVNFPPGRTEVLPAPAGHVARFLPPTHQIIIDRAGTDIGRLFDELAGLSVRAVKVRVVTNQQPHLP